MKKQVIAILLVLALCAALVGCGSGQSAPAASSGGDAAEKVTIQVHMALSTEHPSYKRMEAFAARANELANNTFEFKIYPNSTLGDYTVVTEELIRGTVAMMVDSVNTGIDSRFDLTFTPYLCTSMEDAANVFGPGGFVYEKDKEMLAENQIHLLGFDMLGMGGMELGSNCPEHPCALGGGEGLQVRSPGNEHLRVLLSELGYNPISLNYSDIYTSMQTGVVEGFIGADAQSALDQFKDVISYHLALDMCAACQYIAFSETVWQSLSAEQQSALETAAEEMFAQSITDSIASDSEIYGKMEAAGIQVVYPTDEEMSAIVEMARTKAWPAAKDRLGDELYNALMEEYGVA